MIGKRILTIRKKNNLTQKEFAEKINVSDKAVSKWESGLGDPSIESLKIISQHFAVSLDELILGYGTSFDDTKSVLEKLAKKAKISDIEKMIDSGLNLMSVDEFGNDIVDYFIKYPTDILFDYLLEKKIITLKTYFTVNTSKAIKEMLFLEGYNVSGTMSKGVAFEKDTRHSELFRFLMDSKRYEQIKQTLNFRDKTYKHKYLGIGHVWYAETWRLYGRVKLDLDEFTIKKITSSNDQKLITVITGFDEQVQPDDFEKLSLSIGENASDEIKLWFMNKVLTYNEIARQYNQIELKKWKTEKKDRFSIAELKLSSWMPLVAINDKKSMESLAPHIIDSIIDEKTMKLIASKYDINIFPDSLTYKCKYLALNLPNKDFIEYINSFYKSDYKNFPILEVLKRLNEFPELERDVIIYVYKLKDIHPPFTLINNLIHFTKKQYSLDTASGLNFKIKSYPGGREFAVYNWPIRTNKRAEFFNNKTMEYGKDVVLKQVDNILYYLAKYCSLDTLEVVNELFYSSEKEIAISTLLNEGDIQSTRNLILSDNKASKKYEYLEAKQSEGARNPIKFYHSVSSPNALKLLSTNTKLLSELVDVLDAAFLDDLLNNYTSDKDFELMALLIDHGANLYSTHIAQQDDGWGYMEDVTVSERDPKKTSTMREMIRNTINK